MSNIISITRPSVKQAKDEDSDDMDIDDELNLNDVKAKEIQDIVVPGELITDDPSWMRGHGTYYLGEKTYSAVAGVILRVNKLLSVIPFKGRYNPETGDHVVGRIVDVTNKRWKVDVGAEHDAVLMLGAVNLPGGVLRRKSETDELQMRSFLKEGDLLNAEVQSVFHDGSAALHTRSLRYGKLRNGIFVSIPSNLIIRAKNYAHDLPGGVSVIFGVNGYCWLYKTKLDNSPGVGPKSSLERKFEAGVKMDAANSAFSPGMGSDAPNKLEEKASWDIYSDKNDSISATTKETISRYRNSLLALSNFNVAVNETRLAKAYEISLGYGDVSELVKSDIQKSIAEDLINDEKMRG